MAFRTVALLPLLASFWGVTAGGPVVFEPSGRWHGDDGAFSTFKISVGTPEQEVNVLPDPHRSSMVLISSHGCDGDVVNGCTRKRGYTFENTQSVSWRQMDKADWDVTETSYKAPRPHAGTSFRAAETSIHSFMREGGNNFGTDRITGDGWEVPDQGIMTVTNNYPFVGRIGLYSHYRGGGKDPVSLFDNIRMLRKLKSAAWSYTAGSVADNIPGSLVFGGFDASRFDRNTTLAAMQRRARNSLEVSLKTIIINDDNKPSSDGPVPRYVNLGVSRAGLDFSRPHLEFPDTVCDQISKEIGVPLDEKTGLYIVDDDKHNEFITSGKSLSFEISATPGPQRVFTIPYTSLVVNGTAPNLETPTRYLGIRRSGDSNFNLGRLFFQHVHIVVDHSHPGGPHVLLSQAKYSPDVPHQVREIVPSHYIVRPNADEKLGIILPVVLVCASMIIVVAYMLIARRRSWIPFRKPPPPEQKAMELEEVREWPADRKVRDQDGDEAPIHDVPVYVPRSRPQPSQRDDDDGPGEGPSQPPPPRYSMAIADGASPAYAPKPNDASRDV